MYVFFQILRLTLQVLVSDCCIRLFLNLQGVKIKSATNKQCSLRSITQYLKIPFYIPIFHVERKRYINSKQSVFDKEIGLSLPR